MTEGSGRPDPTISDPGVGQAEHEYRLRQPLGDTRRTIVLRMPSGWARATLSGIEGALLSWAVPALVGVVALLSQGSNPWFQEINMSAAASLGSNFWALSLGAPMSIGGLPISLIPLLWSILEVLILRGLLWSGKSNEPASQWFSVPAYVLASIIILIASPGTASVSAVVVGALMISLIAATWAVVSQTERWPQWTVGLSWLWKGLKYSLAWFGALFLIGSSLLLVSAVTSWTAMNNLSEVLGASGLSGVVLGMVQASYAPVFAGWGVAWASGAGFTLSGGEVSSPGSVPTLPLPAFPVSQLVPNTAPGHWVVWILIGGGALVGALTGMKLRKTPIAQASLTAFVALLGFSFAVGAWLALSTGALGSELMSRLGPVPEAWPLIVVEFAVTGVAVSLLIHPWTIQFAQNAFSVASTRAREAHRRQAATGESSHVENPDGQENPEAQEDSDSQEVPVQDSSNRETIEQ